MAKYFFFGNVWLLVALAMILFRIFARSDPYMVSFTEHGAWLYSNAYTTLVIACFCIAMICFGLMVAHWRKAL